MADPALSAVASSGDFGTTEITKEGYSQGFLYPYQASARDGFDNEPTNPGVKGTAEHTHPPAVTASKPAIDAAQKAAPAPMPTPDIQASNRELVMLKETAEIYDRTTLTLDRELEEINVRQRQATSQPERDRLANLKARVEAQKAQVAAKTSSVQRLIDLKTGPDRSGNGGLGRLNNFSTMKETALRDERGVLVSAGDRGIVDTRTLQGEQNRNLSDTQRHAVAQEKLDARITAASKGSPSGSPLPRSQTSFSGRTVSSTPAVSMPPPLPPPPVPPASGSSGQMANGSATPARPLPPPLPPPPPAPSASGSSGQMANGSAMPARPLPPPLPPPPPAPSGSDSSGQMANGSATPARPLPPPLPPPPPAPPTLGSSGQVASSQSLTKSGPASLSPTTPVRSTSVRIQGKAGGILVGVVIGTAIVAATSAANASKGDEGKAAIDGTKQHLAQQFGTKRGLFRTVVGSIPVVGQAYGLVERRVIAAPKIGADLVNGNFKSAADRYIGVFRDDFDELTAMPRAAIQAGGSLANKYAPEPVLKTVDKGKRLVQQGVDAVVDAHEQAFSFLRNLF